MVAEAKTRVVREKRAGKSGEGPEIREADVLRFGLRDSPARKPDNTEPVSEETVARVAEWIRKHCAPTAHPRRSMFNRNGPTSSYSWKHFVERRLGWPEFYVANGDFIVAALRCGYRAVPTEPGSPNVFFNMRLRTPWRPGQR